MFTSMKARCRGAHVLQGAPCANAWLAGRAGAADEGGPGKRGLGGFLHSVRDVASRVVDESTREFTRLNQVLSLPLHPETLSKSTEMRSCQPEGPVSPLKHNRFNRLFSVVNVLATLVRSKAGHITLFMFPSALRRAWTSLGRAWTSLARTSWSCRRATPS